MDIHLALQTFELDTNEKEIYIILEKHPWITALDLSYKTSINRSTLYRILERLTKKSLVEAKVDDKTTYYATTGKDGFKELLQEEKLQLQKKQEALLVINSLLEKTVSKQLQTAVKFHRGIRGIRHLEWKRCIESRENLYIGTGVWYQYIGEAFAEEIRDEIVKRNIIVKEIINTQHFRPIGESGESQDFNNKTYALSHFFHRFVDPSKTFLGQEIAITENAVHLQSYEENDIVGIEIISPTYARTMKDMFKLMWNQATVGDHRGGENYPITETSPTTAI